MNKRMPILLLVCLLFSQIQFAQTLKKKSSSKVSDTIPYIIRTGERLPDSIYVVLVKSDSLPEWNDTLPIKTTYAIGYAAQKPVDTIFAILSKRFKSSFRTWGERGYHLYTYYNESWANERIFLKVWAEEEINSDSSLSNVIYFMASTNKEDLLKPKTNSRTKIMKYFSDICENNIKTVKTGF